MTSPHQPRRPTWRCAECDDEWPCARRRQELTVEHEGSRVVLALFMARYFSDALADHSDTQMSQLYLRFLGWVRWRAEEDVPKPGAT